MDPFVLTFYAVICGFLGAFVPESLQRWARFLLGAGVGIVAAGILPMLRGIVGY
jgi:hypothetical protein